MKRIEIPNTEDELRDVTAILSVARRATGVNDDVDACEVIDAIIIKCERAIAASPIKIDDNDTIVPSPLYREGAIPSPKAELTDEMCDEFRRLPLSFNDMVRAIYEAGRNSKREEDVAFLLAESKDWKEYADRRQKEGPDLEDQSEEDLDDEINMSILRSDQLRDAAEDLNLADACYALFEQVLEKHGLTLPDSNPNHPDDERSHGMS